MSQQVKYVAILIADDFEATFTQHYTSTAFALMPVLNIPMITYSLQCLASSSIHETFLCCAKLSSQIRDFIEENKKNKVEWSLSMQVTVISESSWQCLGDVLRSVYNQGIIRSVFVLMHVNTMTNINLLPYIKKHTELSKKDSNLVMTMLLSKSMPQRCKRRVFATDSNDKILFYEPDSTEISIPVVSSGLYFVSKHTNLSKNNHKALENTSYQRVYAHNLINFKYICKYICLQNSKIQILSKFTNETGVMICSQTVLSLFLDNFDFRTLDDFIITLIENQEVSQGNIYVKFVEPGSYLCLMDDWRSYKKVSIAIISRRLHSLVPDNKWLSSFQKHLFSFRNIFNCDKSQIDTSFKLQKNALIGPKTTIKPNTEILNSVIAHNCHIGANCSITNCIILPSNSIEDNTTIIDSVIINSKMSLKIDELDSIEDEQSDREALYPFFDTNKSEDVVDIGHCSRLSDIDDDTDLKIFQNEIIDSLLRGYNCKLECENLLVEINSSRYAYNISLSELNMSVITAILQLLTHEHIQIEPSDLKFLQKFELILTYFQPVIENYTKNNQAEYDYLNGIYEYFNVINGQTISSYVPNILLRFYEKDFISEEAIFGWIRSQDDLSDSFRKAIDPFVTWLQEAEEESD